jgi:acyl-CoA synthetase (AMP-forming)/AMP-acid ligase II
VGEIWVSGPSKTLGYWNRAKETEGTASMPGSAMLMEGYLREFTFDPRFFPPGRDLRRPSAGGL